MESFSRRYPQEPPVDLPETFRRKVLYFIQDSFKGYEPRTAKERSDAAILSAISEHALEAIYASQYLHSIVVREEGLEKTGAAGEWLDAYALGCPASKFLDLLDYLLRQRWRGR